jgi:hypothetical protein
VKTEFGYGTVWCDLKTNWFGDPVRPKGAGTGPGCVWDRVVVA